MHFCLEWVQEFLDLVCVFPCQSLLLASSCPEQMRQSFLKDRRELKSCGAADKKSLSTDRGVVLSVVSVRVPVVPRGSSISVWPTDENTCLNHSPRRTGGRLDSAHAHLVKVEITPLLSPACRNWTSSVVSPFFLLNSQETSKHSVVAQEEGRV